MVDRKPFMDLTRVGKWKRLKRKERDCLKSKGVLYHAQDSEQIKVNDLHSATDKAYSTSVTAEDIEEQSFADVEKNSTPKSEATLKDSVFDFLDENPMIDSDDIDSDSDNDSDNARFIHNSFNRQLQNWAIDYQIKLIALTALLSILRKHNCFSSLPIDARTLLKTPTNVPSQAVYPGEYCHFGIEFGLKKIWFGVTEAIKTIELFVNFDGLPLFNSSKGQFWPILGSVLNVSSLRSKCFPIGIYYGKEKPSNVQDYLKEFISELIQLIRTGITLNGKNLGVGLKGICCDAPAKAFILAIKSCTGYFSCTKCKQEGKYIDGRVTFPDCSSTPRTHDGFLNREDEEYQSGYTPLTAIPGFNFVSSIPLDYMHLVCLGVVRTLLFQWKFGKPPMRLSRQYLVALTDNLLSLKPCIPVEFSRKPRSVDEVRYWKATEFRQFLLYTGPVVLRHVFLPHFKDVYNNFLSLHVSIRILLSPAYCYKYNHYAKDLLIYFVQTVKDLYGKHFITHNFHGLTHIADDVFTFGPLDLCSAFKFENFLYKLKKLIRKGDRPLQQVSRRLMEIFLVDTPQKLQSNQDNHYPNFIKPHYSGPLVDGCVASKQFKGAVFQAFKLTTSPSDCCCQLADGSIVIVLNFVYSSQQKSMIMICKQFMSLSDFYGPPLCPSSALGIHEVGNLSDTQQRLVSEIDKKLVLIPFNEKHVVFPLLHLQ